MTRILRLASALLFTIVALISTSPYAAAAKPISCTVTATSVDFGTYNPLGFFNDAVSGTITVSCSAPDNVVIALSAGNSGSFSTRLLFGPPFSNINYNLYTDLSHTMVWGDGTGASTTVALSIGASLSGFATVYGLIPSGQINSKPGTYSDTITVTMTF